MSDWQAADTSAFLPPALSPLITSASTVAGAATSIISPIQSLINAVGSFLIAFPQFDFLGALATEVDNFKNDFLGTGFYMLDMWDYPLRQFQGDIVGQPFSNSFEADVVNAFADEDDPNLPPFSSSAAALLLVTAVENTSALLTSMQAIQSAFSWWNALTDVVDRVSKINFEAQVRDVESAVRRGDIRFDQNPSKQTTQLIAIQRALQEVKDNVAPAAFETNIAPLTPTISSTPKDILDFIAAVAAEVRNPPYPNFEQVSLRTIIPALPQAFDSAFDPLIAALSTGQSFADAVSAIVDALGEKIDQLNDITTAINAVLAQLSALTSLTELDALYVATGSGMAGLATEIENAGNKPLGDSDGFFSGIVLVAGGPSLTSFQNLFGPVGGA